MAVRKGAGELLRSPFDSPAFQPARILELQLDGELPSVPSESPSGKCYDAAFELVRLHSIPLGIVRLDIREGVTPADHGRRVWGALHAEINEHLVRDGLAPVSDLPVSGLADSARPRCLEEREAALAHAPLASVIIATRDRAGSLEVCLDSLLALEYPSYEIIVVDNAPSSTATKDLVVERYGSSSPPVRYIRQDHPGAAAARNRGLCEARGTFVAFTDDDVIVDRWWLLELARSFDGDQVACVTGMILPAELETPSQAWLEQYGGFTKGFRKRRFDMFENRPETPLFPYAAGMFGSGANMAFRTDVLRHLGGFDPATGAGTPARGGEDLAAFFDVIASGHTLRYTPTALLYHRHRRDYESLRQQAYSYGVGLGAYLTRVIVSEPTRLLDVGRRAPQGLAYMLSPTSEKNVNKRSDYPTTLTWLERKGMLYGPLAYMRARRERRELRRSRARYRHRPEDKR